MYGPVKPRVYSNNLIGAVVVITFIIFALAIASQSPWLFLAVPVWLVVGMIAISLTSRVDEPNSEN